MAASGRTRVWIHLHPAPPTQQANNSAPVVLLLTSPSAPQPRPHLATPCLPPLPSYAGYGRLDPGYVTEDSAGPDGSASE